jgi:eukaryotic-like serine/threonine-protein kinase
VIDSVQLIGTRLGNYEIQALLGAGGMASVYRGFDQNLRRAVAIKVLSDPAAQPDFIARFQQEARLIAGLRHPNIVQVYDFGQHDDLTYMVQELLPGPTLQQWLRDLAARGERPTRDDVLAIIRQLAGALDTAHAAGIIHRDVKPANIIIKGLGIEDRGLGLTLPDPQSPTPSPHVVLTDFGIAKHSQLPDITQTGQVIGTPDYLSPEQAKGLPLTPSSDIYSLGVVLYEMLAGRLPFIGGTALGVAMSHIYDAPPPLRSLRPDLPVALEALIQQSLAKDPFARFHSAGALVQALSQAWPADDRSVAALPTDIHEQPTRIWAAKAANAEPAAPLSTAPTASPVSMRSTTIDRTGPAPYGRALGVLLVALLIGGVLLFGRAVRQPVEVSPAAPPAETVPAASEPTSESVSVVTAAPAPTTAPAPTEVLATAPPAPTAAPAPTETPATAPPAPTAAPAPTAVPAPSSEPLDQLRMLLEAGKDDGRAGRAGGAMLSDLSKAKQALDDGNEKRATDRLRDLQKRLLDGVKSKRVDADFARQALAGIDAIAGAYGLELPPIREQDDKDK